MLNGETKLHRHPCGAGLILYIPSKVATDSSFPFKPKESVKISISNNSLIIEGIEPGEI